MNSNHPSALQLALGSEWRKLKPFIRHHYGNHIGEGNHILPLRGVMDEISVTGLGKLIALCARPLQALVPCSGINIPTEVYNWTEFESGTLFWRRLFHYPDRKPVVFQSRMDYYDNRKIIEFVRGGLGLLLRLEVSNGQLIFEGEHYVIKIAGYLIKLPNWLMAGQANITEKQIGNRQIRVEFHIEHPVWGQTFAYSGTFASDQ